MDLAVVAGRAVPDTDGGPRPRHPARPYPAIRPPDRRPQPVRVGQAAAFKDPASGLPAVAVRLGARQVVAYQAVCTHAGCTVGFDPASGLLACPCHGAAFDPRQAGAVVSGPAPTPLAPVRIVVGPDGGLYT